MMSSSGNPESALPAGGTLDNKSSPKEPFPVTAVSSSSPPSPVETHVDTTTSAVVVSQKKSNNNDDDVQKNYAVNDNHCTSTATATAEPENAKKSGGGGGGEEEASGESVTTATYNTTTTAHDSGKNNDNINLTTFSSNPNNSDNDNKKSTSAAAAANTDTNTPQTAMEGQQRKASDPATATTETPVVDEQSDSSLKEMEHEEDPSNDSSASLSVTLLLTTGARHPLKIDAKYLRKQSINVPDYDPFQMSVYTLKELIWREWRSDWDPRPSSPSLIRLISFGKLLDDKVPLSECKFNHDAPNVVHMTVKPQEVIDEEDAKGAKAQYNSQHESNERTPGCRCVIL